MPGIISLFIRRINHDNHTSFSGAFFATPLRSLRQSQPILTSGAADAGPANQHLGFDEWADRAEIGFVLSHFLTLLLILKDLLALFLKLFAHNSRVRLAASAFSRS